MTTRDLLQLTEARRLSRSGEARRVLSDAQVSLHEVAQVCGVTPGAVSRWVRGERRPTGAAAVAFAELLTKIREVGP